MPFSPTPHQVEIVLAHLQPLQQYVRRLRRRLDRLCLPSDKRCQRAAAADDALMFLAEELRSQAREVKI